MFHLLKTITLALCLLAAQGHADESEIDIIKGRLFEKYGYFVAKEMIDFGISKYISAIEENQPVTLTVYLPRSDMPEFERYLTRHKIKATGK